MFEIVVLLLPQFVFLRFFLEAALPALLEIFHRLDTDESGCITREEIAHVPLDMLPPKLLETVSVDSMTDLFELLDVDGGGTLTQNEFVEGTCGTACHGLSWT